MEFVNLSNYNKYFVKELQTKMLKLNLIKYSHYLSIREHEPSAVSAEIYDGKEKIDLRLNNVITVQFTNESIQGYKN